MPRRNEEWWSWTTVPNMERGHGIEGWQQLGPKMVHALVPFQSTGSLSYELLPTWYSSGRLHLNQPPHWELQRGHFNSVISSTSINWQVSKKISKANMTIICTLCHQLESLNSSERQLLGDSHMTFSLLNSFIIISFEAGTFSAAQAGFTLTI